MPLMQILEAISKIFFGFLWLGKPFEISSDEATKNQIGYFEMTSSNWLQLATSQSNPEVSKKGPSTVL